MRVSSPKQRTNRRRAGLALLRRSAVHRSEGGALVEIAVTLPLILLLMTGIFSFSVALYQKLSLAEAISNGGRVLALERLDTDPCAVTAKAIYAAAPGLDSTKMSLTIVLADTSGTTTGTYTTGTCSGAGKSAMSQGGTAKITATYPCTLGVYGVNYAGCTLTSQITEVVQ